MERLKLNLVPGGVLTVCHASQYDNGRTVRFDLYDGDSKVTLAGTETITATLRKPSGAEVTLNVTNTSSDYVDVVTDSDTCDEAGVYLGGLRVVNSSVIIGSANFVLLAEVDPYGQAQLVVRSASGSIVNFNTSVVENLIECIADFAATQASGTPTPAAPIPIVGVDKVNVTRTGKNLLGGSKLLANAQAHLPSGTTNTENKTFTFASTTSVASSTSFTSGITFKQNTAYSFIATLSKSSGTGTNIRFAYTDGTTENLGDLSGTDKQTKVYVSNASKTLKEIRKYSGSGTTILYYDECGIFEGNLSETDFEPYNGTTVIINLGGTYYGGSVDAVTGKITLTYKVVDIGSLTWNYSTNYTYPLFFADLSGKAITDSIICSHFANKGLIINPNVFGSLGNYIIGSSSSLARIFIRDDDYTTASDFKIAMNGAMLVYELSTPIVVYASNTAEIPTINGDNQVFADTGDVAVKYYAKSTD